MVKEEKDVAEAFAKVLVHVKLKFDRHEYLGNENQS